MADGPEPRNRAQTDADLPPVQVDASHYGADYNSRQRYYSYVEQIVLAQEALPPRKPPGVRGHVVEIGVGSGFVARELAAAGFRVETVDIDPALHPDFL